MSEWGKLNTVGISSLGIYIPKYRLSQKSIEEVWGISYPKSERSVIGHDEDSLTMAVEATLSSLGGQEKSKIEGLYFSSVSGPFSEKLHSAFIASIADLKEEIRIADFSGSIRSGTIAMNTAIDQVASGLARSILIVASDSRMAEPQTDQEILWGCGAVSFIISKENPLITIVDRLTINNDMSIFWRRSNELFVHSEDYRFIIEYGYMALMEKGIINLLKKQGLGGEKIKKAVLSSPDGRSYRNLAKRVGISESKIQPLLFEKIGDIGSPHPFLILASTLQDTEPGDLILLAHYGEGVDIFLFRVGEHISEWKNKSDLTQSILNTSTIPARYGRYLLWRDLVKRSTAKLHPFTSSIHMWREFRQLYQLIGLKCSTCGTIHYPIRRVCFHCGNSKDFEEVKLARQGNIFSFTHDHVYVTPDPPLTMAIVELDKGGRLPLQMTDIDRREKVKIGAPVELTFRKLMEGDDFLNYFWKCKLRG